jgi:hypothetical protein
LSNIDTSFPVSGVGLGGTAPDLRIEGAGVGGDVTGMAFTDTNGNGQIDSGDTLFAVTDTGGLYTVSNWSSAYSGGGSWGFRPINPQGSYYYIVAVPGGGPQLNFVTQLTYDNQAIQFSGLAAGPQDVEDGQYGDLLFATDYNGHLYAMDANGSLSSRIPRSACNCSRAREAARSPACGASISRRSTTTSGT